MPSLHIYDPWERLAVRAADAMLTPLRWRRKQSAGPIRRVLLLRLERIGDLIMVLDAIATARGFWPDATIDLAVGSWNEPIARLIPSVDRVLTVDVPWLARGGPNASWATLLGSARGWRSHHYDLAINFEPDIRSNLLAWLSGARRRVGYSSGGGGALLTNAAEYDREAHVAQNAHRLVARAGGHQNDGPTTVRGVPLQLPTDVVSRARTAVGRPTGPIVAIHASGGRPSKQWHPDRFAAVGRELAAARGATIVLTGVSADRPLVDAVKAALAGTTVVDLTGRLSLLELAGVLAEADVLVTGDTGPMHLAAAVGTPVVALFGPSSPDRYGPGAGRHRVLRVDLPCSPCGRVRLPPARCRGHVPECLDRIDVDRVVREATSVIDESARQRSLTDSESSEQPRP